MSNDIDNFLKEYEDKLDFLDDDIQSDFIDYIDICYIDLLDTMERPFEIHKEMMNIIDNFNQLEKKYTLLYLKEKWIQLEQELNGAS